MNKSAFNLGMLSSALFVSSATMATSQARIDCGAVVDQTVDELRIGAASWWSADVEKMAGMAAMTACYKIRANSTVVSDPDKSDQDRDATEHSEGSTQRSASSGLSFKPLSGAASKKPYERARAKKSEN